MTTRSYNQYCGLARALDLVGERWALLVVRELLFGPKRYSDLLAGLPAISTNVLAARLDELEAAGVVSRRVLPPPAASAVYELTPYGRELEEPILALGRWGGRTLGPPTPARAFLPAWALLALRASYRPEAAGGLRGAFELTVDGEAFHVVLAADSVSFAAGPAPAPDVAVATGSDAFLALGAGVRGVRDALADGSVRLRGDTDLLVRFFEAFRFPAATPPDAVAA